MDIRKARRRIPERLPLSLSFWSTFISTSEGPAAGGGGCVLLSSMPAGINRWISARTTKSGPPALSCVSADSDCWERASERAQHPRLLALNLLISQRVKKETIWCMRPPVRGLFLPAIWQNCSSAKQEKRRFLGKWKETYSSSPDFPSLDNNIFGLQQLAYII